jgi:hypothetical protein
MGAEMAKELVAIERQSLTPTQFGDLADVPPSSNGSPTSPIPKPAALIKTMLGSFPPSPRCASRRS